MIVALRGHRRLVIGVDGLDRALRLGIELQGDSRVVVVQAVKGHGTGVASAGGAMPGDSVVGMLLGDLRVPLLLVAGDLGDPVKVRVVPLTRGAPCLTVGAARSFASSPLTPLSWYDSFMCSYWRSRFVLDPAGIGLPFRDGLPQAPAAAGCHWVSSERTGRSSSPKKRKNPSWSGPTWWR